MNNRRFSNNKGISIDIGKVKREMDSSSRTPSSPRKRINITKMSPAEQKKRRASVNKFEEETRIAQGMENVLNHGFSRDQDEGFINYEDPSDPDKS